MVDEAPSSKSGPSSRSSSKRCRAAEVHNLSEKVLLVALLFCCLSLPKLSDSYLKLCYLSCDRGGEVESMKK